MNIEELREKNIKELNTLEIRKQQLETEMRALLQDLGYEKMPSLEAINAEIEKAQGLVLEKEKKLSELLAQYETVVTTK